MAVFEWAARDDWQLSPAYWGRPVSKKLFLLRHAKSNWSAPVHNDHDRPLNRRGERAAAVIGIMMRQEKTAPDFVLCSSARRTIQTKDTIRPYLPHNCPVEKPDGSMKQTWKIWFSVLCALPDSIQKPLLVGHNPGLSQLAISLCGAAGGEALDRLREKFPTGALATITLDIDAWSDIAQGRGRLDRFVVPKELV